MNKRRFEETRMKDKEEVWVVLRTGASLHTAIRCGEGKQKSKEIRKTMQQRYGGEWTSKKTTQKELDAART